MKEIKGKDDVGCEDSQASVKTSPGVPGSFFILLHKYPTFTMKFLNMNEFENVSSHKVFQV